MEADLGYAPLMILTKHDGRLIGSGGVVPVKDTPDVEIAYHFLPSAWGKGYATEAVRAVLAWSDAHLEAARTVCMIDPQNLASIRVAEKCGYREFARTTFESGPALFFERLRAARREDASTSTP